MSAVPPDGLRESAAPIDAPQPLDDGRPRLPSMPMIGPAVLDMVQSVTGLETAFIADVSPERDELHFLHARNLGAVDVVEDSSIAWSDSVCKRAAESGVWATDDVHRDLPGSTAADQLGIRTYVGVPIHDNENHLIATLCGVSHLSETIDPKAQTVMSMLAEVLSNQWERERLHTSEMKYLGGLEQQARQHAILLAEAEHRLKTRLAIIAGWAETLLHDATLMRNPSWAKGINGIHESSILLTGQMNDLLEDARSRTSTGTLRNQRFNISALISKIANDLPKISSTNHHISQHVQEGLLIDGDPETVNQIVWHLAENAVKYSPRGGEICFDLKLVENPSDETAGEEKIVQLVLTDEGIGIPPTQHSEEIFAPFIRGTNTDDIPGTGLGLHIVRRLVMSMNGTISLNRRETKGTKVTLTLPVPRVTDLQSEP